jgi:hypothetical protein
VGTAGAGITVDIPFSKLLIVSAVVMGLSHTLARERIFEPLRNACGGMKTWGGYLLSCPYCASHYLAFLMVPLTGSYSIHVAPRWPYVSPALDWFLSSILVTVVAAFLRVGFYFIDEGQRLQQQRKKITKADVALRERTLQ